MIDREPDVPEERRIRFRIGVNLDDVIVEEPLSKREAARSKPVISGVWPRLSIGDIVVLIPD
jgi:hypothetical protein